MSMGSASESLDDLASAGLATEWVAAFCMTCLLYDHLLTLSQEISGMWTPRISLPRVLFFLNRYVVQSMIIFNSIASSRAHLSTGFCVFYLRWLLCTTTVASVVVEGILIARVWVLYQSNIPMLCLAGFFYLGGVITLVGLTIQDYIGESVLVNDNFSNLPGCYASKVPSIIAGSWIAPVIVESVLFFLVVYRVFSWWRDVEGVPPVLIVLARDSSVYFAIIFILLLANLLMFEYGPASFAALLVSPSNTAGCIAGSRMLLNLRALAEEQDNDRGMELSVLIHFDTHPEGLTTTLPDGGVGSSNAVESYTEVRCMHDAGVAVRDSREAGYAGVDVRVREDPAIDSGLRGVRDGLARVSQNVRV